MSVALTEKDIIMNKVKQYLTLKKFREEVCLKKCKRPSQNWVCHLNLKGVCYIIKILEKRDVSKRVIHKYEKILNEGVCEFFVAKENK